MYQQQRLPTIQGVLKEIGKAKLQSFEVEINLMETWLWNKQVTCYELKYKANFY